MDMYITMMQRRNTGYIGIKLLNRFIVGITLIVLLLSYLCSCRCMQVDAPQVISEYEIPFVDVNSKWSEIQLVEQDDYGRMLFSIWSNGKVSNNVFSDYVLDDLSNSPVLAYLICQRIDDDDVYYYKDCCYIYVTQIPAEIHIIEEFKKINDWCAPLDTNKMEIRSANLEGITDYKLYQSEKDVIQKLEEWTGTDIDNYYLDVIFSDQKEPIYVARIVEKWAEGMESNSFGSTYACAYDDVEGKMRFLELDADVNVWREQINTFKTD